MNFKFCRYLINCKKHLLWIFIFFISYFFDSCKFYEIITELQCSWFYINSHDLKLLTVESRNLCNTRKSLVNVLFSHLVDIFTPKSTREKYLKVLVPVSWLHQPWAFLLQLASSSLRELVVAGTSSCGWCWSWVMECWCVYTVWNGTPDRGVPKTR